MQCHTFTASVAYQFFLRRNACQKYFFQILSQKDAQIVNLENPDLDLIRRIRPESGFKGFMSRFWICPPKTQNPFLDSEIRIWIFPTKTQPPPPQPRPALKIKKIINEPDMHHHGTTTFATVCHCANYSSLLRSCTSVHRVLLFIGEVMPSRYIGRR